MFRIPIQVSYCEYGQYIQHCQRLKEAARVMIKRLEFVNPWKDGPTSCHRKSKILVFKYELLHDGKNIPVT